MVLDMAKDFDFEKYGESSKRPFVFSHEGLYPSIGFGYRRRLLIASR